MNNRTQEDPFGYPVLHDLDDYFVCDHPCRVSPEFLLNNGLIPVQQSGSEDIYIVVSDPMNVLAIDSLADGLGSQVSIQVAPEPVIRKKILDEASQANPSTRDLMNQSDGEQKLKSDNLESRELLASDPKHPLVLQLVDSMISQAVESRASDIHLEPEQTRLRVRYRIDGLLRDMDHPPGHLRDRVISRMKVMAGMDIANRLTPQDGNISVTRGGSPVDIRVSSIPTPLGERLVLRLLGRSELQMSLSGLGGRIRTCWWWVKSGMERLRSSRSSPLLPAT